MPDIIKRWESEFRKAAKADDLALFRNHLLKLGLPDEPESLLNGTILVVQACCTYAKLDSHSPAGFLALQKYNPAEVEDARYAFTFDLCGKAFARVLLSAKVEPIDLADLYGHPWWEHEVCGYSCFWVSRTDGDDLSDDEIELIEKEVTEDLRFDYSEDELNFWFDDSAVEGALFVMLNDVYDSTGEDEE